MTRVLQQVLLLFSLTIFVSPVCGQTDSDATRKLQSQAIQAGRAPWGYWGTEPDSYYNWCQHSNRLVPVYTFGITLDSVRGTNNVYRSRDALTRLYGQVPEATWNPNADYFDQTNIYDLQMAAIDAGKKHIILMVFDGMDWQTARAAASYRAGRVAYGEGRGTGLRIQDYRGVVTDFGFCVTSPHNEGTEFDVNSQTIKNPGGTAFGGYDPQLAGTTPWDIPRDSGYLLGWNADRYHVVTDSANGATAMVTGVKTYNGSVNIGVDGRRLTTVAEFLQARHGFSIGVATNVPISHATPAAAYAHNVSRLDYQDLTRDLVGLPSVSHPSKSLLGMDVVLGSGWGERAELDPDQGENFSVGNKYITDMDRGRLHADHGGKYVIVERTAGQTGSVLLAKAAQDAVERRKRLLGIFGVNSGHLPYQTADGDYHPTNGVAAAEVYSRADITENPTLADMTRAALNVLSTNPRGFWFMVEAGDLDWASHDVNIDNTIGAILSGDEAFNAVTTWVEQHQAWQDTAMIVTSDHGHGFVLKDLSLFVAKTRLSSP